MKILLLGEYSNLHNSLKKGLVEIGHEVTLISSGDGFKGLESDILLKNKSFPKKYSILKKLFLLIFGYPLRFYRNSIQFQSILSNLRGYDYVQLINEHAIGGVPWIERRQLSKLSKQNKNIVLLCCGDDYNSIKFYLNSERLNYSILTPLLQKLSLKREYNYSLKYLTKPFKKLSKHIEKISLGVIASDMDYHLPLRDNPNYLGMIPNPIVLKIEKTATSKNSEITILLGINTNSYIKKGIIYFEEALKIITAKYPEVIIKKTENLPFHNYIQELGQTEILLDQIFSYDQGYNALQAMAMGKVVFTGAEKDFLDYYDLSEDEVAINALPDVNYLVKKLSHLIDNPSEIKRIGENAKHFIRKHHEATKIAHKYIETWTNAKELSE